MTNIVMRKFILINGSGIDIGKSLVYGELW